MFDEGSETNNLHTLQLTQQQHIHQQNDNNIPFIEKIRGMI